jgi:large subunit ribosomal protein L25
MSNERQILEVSVREPGPKGVGRRLRASGLIPAVVYGPGVEPVSVSIEPRALQPIVNTAYGRNNVFMVQLDGQQWQCMVKERQIHPVRRNITHVDFYVVKDDQTILVDVPVSTVGKSLGERAGGRLQIVSRTVKLKCQVKDIPPTVEHDVTQVELAQSVYIDEITPPSGCEFVYRNRFPVLLVARRRGAKAQAAEA